MLRSNEPVRSGQKPRWNTPPSAFRAPIAFAVPHTTAMPTQLGEPARRPPMASLTISGESGRQVELLEGLVRSMIEASELTSTDDERDPEGATIAYERAQAIALLRQALNDLDALVVTRGQLESGHVVVCSVCGRTIDLERVAALPTTSRCIHCAA
jgi:RNA polymerase-binding transcription factor DksA